MKKNMCCLFQKKKKKKKKNMWFSYEPKKAPNQRAYRLGFEQLMTFGVVVHVP